MSEELLSLKEEIEALKNEVEKNTIRRTKDKKLETTIKIIYFFFIVPLISMMATFVYFNTEILLPEFISTIGTLLLLIYFFLETSLGKALVYYLQIQSLIYLKRPKTRDAIIFAVIFIVLIALLFVVLPHLNLFIDEPLSEIFLLIFTLFLCLGLILVMPFVLLILLMILELFAKLISSLKNKEITSQELAASINTNVRAIVIVTISSALICLMEYYIMIQALLG